METTSVHYEPDAISLSRHAGFPIPISQRKLLLAGVDLALLNGILLLGLQYNSDTALSPINIMLRPVWYVTLTTLWLIIASAGNNYSLKQAAQVSTSVFGVIKALFITGIIYAFLPLLSPPLPVNRSHILLFAGLTAGLLSLWRVIYATVLVQPNFQRRALIVGAGWAGCTIAQVIKDHDPDYKIIGYIDDDEAKQGQVIEGARVLGKRTDLNMLVKAYRVSDIVMAITHDMHEDVMREVLKCYEQAVRIVCMPVLFEQTTGRIPVKHIGERWLISLPIDRESVGLYPVIKRVIDVVIASFGLLILAPFFPFIALTILLDSPGSIFYRPERIGRGGKPFRLWKFRTMVPNADCIGDPTFTKKKDKRITRIGRILRATHIDELLQFINILKGEMSVVGPRPERYVPELEEKIPFYRIRYGAKPGAAGWALVKQGYAEGADDTLIKLEYDLYYIKHLSLSLDILIIVKTAVRMLTLRGR